MGGVAKAVTSAVDTVVDTVGSAVESVGHAVEKVGDTVGKAVDGIVQSAKNDPLTFAANMAAVATGQIYLLPMIAATSTLAHGKPLSTALENAAVAYVAGEAGQAAGAEFAGSSVQPAVSGAAAGTTGAALKGGDIGVGAVSGAINSTGNSALNGAINAQTTSGGSTSQTDTPEYKPTTDYSVKADYGAPTQSPLGSVNGQGINAELIQTPIGSNSPIDYGLNTTPSSGADSGGLGLQPSDSTNINRMNGAQGLTLDDGSGTLGARGYTSDNASPNLGDPDSMINKPDVLGKDVAGTDTSWNVPIPKFNWAGALGIGVPDKQGGQRPTSGLNSVMKPATTANTAGANGKLDGTAANASDLLGGSSGEEYDLEKLKQLYGSLTPEMRKALTTNNGSQEASATIPMASGGSTSDPWGDLVNSAYSKASTSSINAPFIGGGQRRVVQITPLTQLSNQIAQHRAEGGLMSQGGLPKGHNPEFVTGQTGYYASGKGTGQSDDIPAVLQHGDFVVDADTVAALGDGSSKAGALALENFRKHIPVRHQEGGKAIPAQIADGEYVLPAAFVTTLGKGDNARGAKMLDAMRHQIREHKRSAPTSKIPPKAKSPLEYIKMGTKG